MVIHGSTWQYTVIHVIRSINLQKKNSTNVFPVRTKQASSIKVLLLWLYFEYPDGTAYFIGDNARATIRRKNLFLLRHFRRSSAKSFGQTTKKVSTSRQNLFFRISFQEHKSVNSVIAKFGPLREPIRMLHFTLDQFSHIINGDTW